VSAVPWGICYHCALLETGFDLCTVFCVLCSVSVFCGKWPEVVRCDHMRSKPRGAFSSVEVGCHGCLAFCYLTMLARAGETTTTQGGVAVTLFNNNHSFLRRASKAKQKHRSRYSEVL